MAGHATYHVKRAYGQAGYPTKSGLSHLPGEDMLHVSIVSIYNHTTKSN